MSTIARAAQIIRDHGSDPCREPECIAQDLADAGLLAPDLPGPQEHGGELVWPLADPDGWAVTATDNYIRLSDERGAIITINRKLARDLGHIFLAAANHVEVEQ